MWSNVNFTSPRRYGHAIVPARLGSEPNAHPTEVVGDHYALGEIAVERTDLVVRGNKKAIVEKWLRCERMLESGGLGAFVQIRREGVVVGARRQHKHAALGRIRVDVVEVFEVGRVLELAEERYAVLVFRLRGGERRAECDGR